MEKIDELDVARKRKNLEKWILKCQEAMGHKFPKIDFQSDHWPVKTIYKTDKANVFLASLLKSLRLKERNFSEVARCLNASYLLESKTRSTVSFNKTIQMLAQTECESIFHLSLEHLKHVERECISKAQKNKGSAGAYHSRLSYLEKIVKRLADEGVISPIGYHVLSATKKTLLDIRSQYVGKKSEHNESDLLDCKIAALNDAINALYDDDPRLNSADRVVIALLARMMCAPSRVNEVMCSSIDDHVVIEDYSRNSGQGDMQEAYKMLLITMKGSKGANWSAKPALNFMIDLFNYATAVIAKHGERSRMLARWYEENPKKIYLPPEIEYLRGQDLSRQDVSNIINLNLSGKDTSALTFRALKKKIFFGPNPKHSKFLRRKQIHFLKFKVVERHLLIKVHEAMNKCRRTTSLNHYKGKVSDMLCLFDDDQMLFLPSAMNYRYVNRAIMQRRINSRLEGPPTIFEALGITMPVAGTVQTAWMQSHDPRRWLSTQALRHGKNLSDVLINKWANRLKLGQLKAYDMRTSDELSDLSTMPACEELDDISAGIQRVASLQEKFGLKANFVTVLDANIRVTSMSKVFEAVNDRPVARNSEQLIILYPSQFGVCLHQHHETPCRNYESCLPCDNNVVVKGHTTSNDRIRERAQLLRTSVIRQLNRLVLAHNQGIADEPDQLASHILKLSEKGLSGEELADNLIDEFHEIAELVSDKLLYQRLQEAFVASGYTKRFDAEKVKNGALIKYHNPAYHSSPGLERALESHGGRKQIVMAEIKLQEKYPQFKSIDTNRIDARHLQGIDDENELDDESEFDDE